MCDDELLVSFRAFWLERWRDALVKARPTVAMETLHARIELLAADGVQRRKVAKALGASEPTVAL